MPSHNDYPSRPSQAMEFEYAQRITQSRPEDYDNPVVNAAFYRFTAQDIATFYAASYAVQMAAHFPDITRRETAALMTGLERSEKHIALASIDALTREYLSAREGGTVLYKSLVNDPKVENLAESLSTPNRYITAESQAIFSQLPKAAIPRLPQIIPETMLGIRLEAAASVSRIAGLEQTKRLSKDIGGMAVILFDAMNRNLHQEIIGQPYVNWLAFARAIETFGKTTNQGQEIAAVDSMIGAQHANQAGGGIMLVRTCNDFRQVYELLEATRDQSRTPELLPFIEPQVLAVINRRPNLNAFKPIA